MSDLPLVNVYKYIEELRQQLAETQTARDQERRMRQSCEAESKLLQDENSSLRDQLWAARQRLTAAHEAIRGYEQEADRLTAENAALYWEFNDLHERYVGEHRAYEDLVRRRHE